MYSDSDLPMTEDTLDRLARRAAGLKLGLALHAGIYLLVNLLLAALAVREGRPWDITTAAGWGMGLVLQGLIVWLALPGGGICHRMLTRERELLRRRQR